MAERLNNIAAFRVTLDGKDLTDRIAPRLISLSISEKRGGEADQLDIVVHDHDGKMAIPKEGATLRVSIGWKQGADVAVGMIDKGSFKVDEAEHSGAPDIVTIRGRSADFTSSFRTRKEKSYRSTTLGAVVRDVAATNGLEARVAPELDGVSVPVLGQDGRSDMAIVRALGRRHDAIATVKDGKLIFSPVGKPATAGGETIPAVFLTRRSGDSHSYRRVEREQHDGVEARYHDQDAAKRKTEKVALPTNGSASSSAAVGAAVNKRITRKPKRLKRTFATREDAAAAASAEAKRIVRRGAEFDYTLALGRPDLYPDRPVTVAGFKPEIDATKWLIAEVTHTLDADGGLATKLKLETAV